MSTIKRQYCLVKLRRENDTFISVDAIYNDYDIAVNAKRWHNAHVALPDEYYTIWSVVMGT